MRILQYAVPLVGGAAAAWLIFDAVRRGPEPDFLREFFPACLERNGLCFDFDLREEENGPRLEVRYQNRYDRRATARVAVRLYGRPKMEPIYVDFECPPAGYQVGGGTKVTLDLPDDESFPNETEGPS